MQPHAPAMQPTCRPHAAQCSSHAAQCTRHAAHMWPVYSGVYSESPHTCSIIAFTSPDTSNCSPSW
eukprot:359155-Chlamydomonas_euryale.AAC.4